MAIQCSLCGTTLKDDAHFCNICGTLVATHPFSPKTKATASSSIGEPNRGGEVLREQIAQQPPARPSRNTGNSQPPSWMSQLESGVGINTFPGGNGVRRSPQDDSAPSSNGVSFQEPGTRPQAPGRELRAKVWEQAQGSLQRSDTNDRTENLPTRPLLADTPIAEKQMYGTNSSGTLSSQRQRTRQDDVDQLDTVPMATPKGVKPNNPARPALEPARLPQPGSQRESMNRQATAPPRFPDSLVQQQPASSPTVQRWDEPTMITAQNSALAPDVKNQRQTPPPLTSARRTTPPKRSKSQKPFILVMVILLLLLIGSGISAWIILYAPFTVASVTQPQQTLNSSQLRISLQYPSGWTTQIDAKKATATLSDSSHTAQFIISSRPANGEDTGRYLQQEASQLAMTGLKPLTAQTFAGISWQELQGNTLIKGASYTETLFASVHQQNMYTIMQLAPQTTYAQEEQYIFSAIRSSLQFVA